MTNLNRREKRRIAKQQAKNDAAFAKQFRLGLNVALASDQYKGLEDEENLSKEDERLLFRVMERLYNMCSPEEGLSVQELAHICLDEEYSDAAVRRIERIIQHIKRISLKLFIENVDNKNDHNTILLCKIDNKIFNASDPEYLKYTVTAFEQHGLYAGPQTPSGTIVTKKGGIITMLKDQMSETGKNLPPELQNLHGKEFEDMLNKLYPIEEDSRDNGGNVIFENLKGNYTSEQGISELGYLVHGINEIAFHLKDGEGISELERSPNDMSNMVACYYYMAVTN